MCALAHGLQQENRLNGWVASLQLCFTKDKLNFMPLAKEEVKFWQRQIVQKSTLNWVENRSFIQTNWKLYSIQLSKMTNSKDLSGQKIINMKNFNVGRKRCLMSHYFWYLLHDKSLGFFWGLWTLNFHVNYLLTA